LLIVLGPETEERPAKPLVPPVEFLVARAGPHQFFVRTQGTVTPSTETTLIPEVSGRIVEVSPRFEAGAFFERGDVLARIEPTRYEAALAEAEARLEGARLALAQEEAARQQAEEDWRDLGRGAPSALALRAPQRAQAEAE